MHKETHQSRVVDGASALLSGAGVRLPSQPFAKPTSGSALQRAFDKTNPITELNYRYPPTNLPGQPVRMISGEHPSVS